MTISLPTLDDLVESIEGQQTDPLERLAEAVSLAHTLGILGEHLIGHFVDAAKASGQSWTGIGSALGVSKQAAQQRFVPRPSTTIDGILASSAVAAYTGRAVDVLRQAEHHARRRSHGIIGTGHLLLGILDEPEGIGAHTIETLGATAAEVRQQLRGRLTVAADVDEAAGDEGAPVLGPRVQKAIDLALREALRLGHNYVGTEHQLLGLLLVDDDTAAEVLGALGITHELASAQIVRLINAHQRRAARTRRREPDPSIEGVVVVEADAFAKAQLATDALVDGRPVLLDLRVADTPLRRRAIDLVSGAALALGAEIRKVGAHGVVAIPAGSQLDEQQIQGLMDHLAS